MSNREVSGGAIGLTMFASVMLMVVGVFQILAGLAGIFNDDKLLVTQDYILSLDTSAWGWIHLLIGLILFFAGTALMRGAVWARTIAVLIAAGSAITAFAWLPAQPFWGLTIIVLDIFVIWALTAHGRDVTKV